MPPPSTVFFPKQFTVGVLNATLDLAALVLVGVVGLLGSEWSCLPLSPVVSLHVGGGCWCVAAFLGSEVVLSPVVSGCLPSCGVWVLVGVAASRTKTFRNQNHRFQSKFAYCKLFGVYAGVILTTRDLQSHSSSSAKKDPDAMDIGAMSKGKKGDDKKGKTKGKMVCHGCDKVGHKLSECRSSGKGKGGDRIDMVKCWNRDGYGHYGKDCPSRFNGKSGGKPKGGGRAFGKKADDKGKGKGGKSANTSR